MGRFAVQPRRAKPVRAILGYYGGKARLGPWIASLLPFDARGLYCEPCSGMAAVWAHRQPCKHEILNDRDERVVNWWRVGRDHNREFRHLLNNTCYSRDEFEWALSAVDDPGESPAKRALAFTLIVQWSMAGGGEAIPANFGTIRKAATLSSIAERVKQLQERLRNVVIENRDMVELLYSLRGKEHAVIYVDPPYTTANHSPYRVGSVAVPSLTRALQAQTGAVAISGYAPEWDHLGWKRHERTARATAGSAASERVECVWTNYDPATGERL